MNIESLLPVWAVPWRGVALALLIAAAWALLAGRLLQRAWLAAPALGLATLAGWLCLLPLLLASPRQVLERLPALLLGVTLLATLCAALPPLARWPRLCGWILALLAAWWLAGAPLHDADIRRALPLVLLAGVAAAVLPRWLGSAGAAAGAAAALAVAALLAGWRGPAVPLAATLTAAALGLTLDRRAWGPPARVTAAVALVALAAVPVLARNAAADGWATLAPLLALWFAPWIGRRLPRRVSPWLAWAIAAAPAWLAVAWAAGRLR